MRLKPLFIGILAVLLGSGTAWSVGSNNGRWAWELAPKVAGYVPDPKDVNFYYPLPEVEEVTSPYGYRVHPIYGDRRLHSGTDLGAPEGMPVLAAHAGYVKYADWGDGYGKMIILEYADGKYQTYYAHLSEILVKEGDAIRPRQVIGKVGSTGGVTGPHLHFELRRRESDDFAAIDPTGQIKAVEAFVAVRPPDFTPANPSATGASKPVASQPADLNAPWQAPALKDNPQPAIATAAAPPTPPKNNGILDFNPIQP